MEKFGFGVGEIVLIMLLLKLMIKFALMLSGILFFQVWLLVVLGMELLNCGILSKDNFLFFKKIIYIDFSLNY